VEEGVEFVYECFSGQREVGAGLPRFETDETEPTGEGTRGGMRPRRRAARRRPPAEPEAGDMP